MRLILSLSVVVILFAPFELFAETKEIVSEGTYNMGDGETPSVAESRALLKAKQIALEQAGTYVESYSKVKNLTLTQDEIQVLASGLMEVEILDKKRTIVGDGINFWVKIKAKVNPDKMEEMARRVKEKSVVEDYQRVQDAYAKSLKEIDELKTQLAQTEDDKGKKRINAKVADNEKLFKSNEWFEKGYSSGVGFLIDDIHLFGIEYYDSRIEAYTHAIALNPRFASAYIGRGIAHYNKEQYDRAIEDYNKGIDINPKDNKGYYFRAVAFISKGHIKKALRDFRKACDMGDETSCQELRKSEHSK